MKRMIAAARSAFVAGAVLTIFTATGAVAQESTNRVAANTDWSVFVEDNPTGCWSVSAPTKVVNTRDGRAVAAKRGDIRLFVSYHPGSQVKGQVSFAGGYPFDRNKAITLTIDTKSYQLYSEGSPQNRETAWANPSEEAQIVAAMKRGAKAVVTAYSSRGTRTEDTFSLLGFTAAVDEAAKRCGN
ncbi:hypothetical protein SAMN04488527_10363 [Aliiroseovarius crassostreae]|nr:hypothetical protein SAMN04488527_10363 [Aliiroseovarius crassostreae]